MQEYYRLFDVFDTNKTLYNVFYKFVVQVYALCKWVAL